MARNRSDFLRFFDSEEFYQKNKDSYFDWNAVAENTRVGFLTGAIYGAITFVVVGAIPFGIAGGLLGAVFGILSELCNLVGRLIKEHIGVEQELKAEEYPSYNSL